MQIISFVLHFEDECNEWLNEYYLSSVGNKRALIKCTYLNIECKINQTLVKLIWCV